mmetsp:Transcript_60505/g.136749  ORF Transcript_60505/g.136749 Transcript_60505/m.136749 type:complete len:266 (-) Transcript_60505:541-1338(-)
MLGAIGPDDVPEGGLELGADHVLRGVHVGHVGEHERLCEVVPTPGAHVVVLADVEGPDLPPLQDLGEEGQLRVAHALVEILDVESLAVVVFHEGPEHRLDNRRIRLRSEVVVLELEDLDLGLVALDELEQLVHRSTRELGLPARAHRPPHPPYSQFPRAAPPIVLLCGEFFGERQRNGVRFLHRPQLHSFSLKKGVVFLFGKAPGLGVLAWPLPRSRAPHQLYHLARITANTLAPVDSVNANKATFPRIKIDPCSPRISRLLRKL